MQQRGYIRVDDHLPLSWKKVEAAKQEEIAAFFRKNGVPPPNQGDNLRQLLAALDIQPHLKRLEKSSADLAYILGRMDAKLNMLLQLSYPGLKDQPMVPTPVNLGGGGIAFWEGHPAELAVGDLLEVRLALSVGALAVVDLFVRVIDISKKDSKERVKIACCFDPVLDEVREQIIQHVFKRQATILRAKHRVT